MVLVVLYESQALRKFATNKEFPREIFNATFLRLGLKNTYFVCIHSKNISICEKWSKMYT